MPAASELAELRYTNLFRNPDMNSVAGVRAWWGDGGGGRTEVVDAPWTASGKAVRFTRTVDLTNPATGGPHFDVRPAAWLETSKRYTIVFEYTGSGDYSTNGTISAYPNQDGPVARSKGGYEVAGDTPRRVWATFDLAEKIAVEWQALIAAQFGPGSWFEIGNVDIYEGNYDPERPFFSGARDTGGYVTEWAGTPNASPSHAYR